MRTIRNRGMAKIATVVFLAASTLILFSLQRIPSASAQAAGELFIGVSSQEGSVAASSAPAALAVSRSRAVRLNLGALTGGAEALNESRTVALNLFDDAYLFADRDRFERRADGSYTWFGRIGGDDSSWAILTVEQGVLAASISYGGRQYRVRLQDEEIYLVQELDESAFPPEDCAPGPEEKGDQSLLPPEGIAPELAGAADDSLGDACGNVIDVMALYTDDVEAHYTVPAINAEIQNSVDQANQIYINSGIGIRIRLVHKGKLTFDEKSTLADDVTSLKDPSDGNGDIAHTWRNTYGADLVALLLYNGAGYCGRAYDIMNPVSVAWASKAFCVVAYDCSSSNKSFAHELAHLQGARHDWCVDPTDSSPYTYNHGLTVNGYGRSVMAYSSCCSSGCGRLLYFSNPDISVGGYTWGVPVGSLQAADNRRTLNNTRCTVASFRSTVLNLTVTSPNGGNFWVPGSTHSITWTRSGFPAGSNVRIELYKGGTYDSTIAASTPNDGTHSWAIPGGTVVGSDYRVRISWVDSPSVYDESDANFSINYYSLHIIHPLAKEIWHPGIPGTITWEMTGPLGRYVDIVLYKADRRLQKIVSAAVNRGYYRWQIPGTLTPGGDYRVEVIPLARTSVRARSDYFALVKPDITLTAPSDPGMVWEAGTTREITWTKTAGLGGDVRLELWKGGVFNSLIAGVTPNDGSFRWRIPIRQTPGADYAVKILSLLTSNVTDVSDNPFTITRPVITVIFPYDNTRISASQLDLTLFHGYAYPIRWRSTPGVGRYVRIDLLKGKLLSRVIALMTANDGAYEWTVPADLAPGEDYRIRITSSLWAGIGDTSGPFAIAAPYLRVYTPNGGETWAAGSTQQITWFTPGRGLVNGFAGAGMLITDRVRIELRKGAKLYQYITSPLRGTADTGWFSWLLPFDLPAGKDYSIRIVSLTRPGLEDKSDHPFSVSRPGEFAVLSPNGGETILWGSYTIRWVSDETPSGVSIDLCTAAGCQPVVADTPNSGSYWWLVPPVIGSNFRIRITALSDPRLTDMSDADFSISSFGPVPGTLGQGY